MSRRQRHLNARHTGAHLVLDARRISGLADAASVSSWNDVSGNARNATQATGTKQPSYRVNVRGGQPVVRFDGGDGLATSSYSASIAFDVLCVFATTSAGQIIFERGATFNAAGAQYLASGTNATLNASSDGTAAGLSSKNMSSSSWANDGVFRIAAHVHDGTHAGHLLRLNGVTQSMTTALGYSGNLGSGSYTQASNIGARNNGATAFLTGDIALLIHAPLLSISMRKRLEHAAALSFKMSCS